MRLIDVDMLNEKIDMCRKEYNGFNNIDGVRAIDIAQSLIYQAPIIEAEPVKYGRWIKALNSRFSKQDEKIYCYDCSICGFHTGDQAGEFNYCPHCGDKMEDISKKAQRRTEDEF